MMSTLAAVVWILLLLSQILSAPVFSAPTKDVERHLQNVTTTFGVGMKMHKTKGRLEKSPIKTRAEENSVLKKKTTVSVNGKVLPLAALSATDKNIHVTLQQSPQNNQQATPLRPGQVVAPLSLQRSPPQALVQEVAPGTLNSQVNLQGNQESLNSPKNLQVQEVPNSLSSLPQAPGTLHSPPNLQLSSSNTDQGQGPFHSPPNLQLSSSNTDQGQGALHSPPNLQLSSLNTDQGQGAFHSPPNLQLSSSNTGPEQGPFHSPPNLQLSSLNAAQEQQPFHSPTTNTRGQGLLQSPPLNSVQELPQGPLDSPQNVQGQKLLSSHSEGVPQGALANQKLACNTALNGQSPQSATTLVNLGQNSEGQLTYKPLRC